jgi:hypothetical protein
MRYQPIENHGIVGNMHSAALVGLDGSVDWLCLPRFDSPSVFGAILDADKGGRFRIGGRGGDDGPGRLVGEQLQRQGRAQDHLAPPAAVGAAGRPPLPVGDRLAEPVLGLLGPGAPSGAGVRGDHPQDEGGTLALAEGERGHRPAAVGPEGDRSGQPQGQSRAVEAGAELAHRDGVLRPGVVERRAALHHQRTWR